MSFGVWWSPISSPIPINVVCIKVTQQSRLQSWSSRLTAFPNQCSSAGYFCLSSSDLEIWQLTWVNMIKTHMSVGALKTSGCINWMSSPFSQSTRAKLLSRMAFTCAGSSEIRLFVFRAVDTTEFQHHISSLCSIDANILLRASSSGEDVDHVTMRCDDALFHPISHFHSHTHPRSRLSPFSR